MKAYDNAIARPSGFDDYVCDPKIKIRIMDHINAARKRGTMPPHLLLTGGPGTGKTTLAGIIARTLNVPILKFVGRELTKKEQLLDLFQVPEYGGILFIDEIHSVSREIMELLYPVMEDGTLPAKGNAKLQLRLNPLMVIGATTEMGSLAKPLVDRFTVKIKIPDYTLEQMGTIVRNMSAKLAGAKFEDEALQAIASRAKYTPRVAGGLLTQVLDSAVANGVKVISYDFILDSLHTLGVGSDGLDATDEAVLGALLGTPLGMGLETLAMSVQEDPEWVATGIEPFLIRKGYMLRTKAGRVLTDMGRELAMRHQVML